ncbi:MAG: alcohol dehydrogenase [Flavisolibacter sp.]|nr:alcohol dehydrogenase [Flavisolibacter sp.]
MEKRTLGKTGLEVSPLAFGGNVFGWTVDEKRSFELLDAWADIGFNFIDTADSYSNWVPGNKGGESETIIGNWMKKHGNRDKLIISTKVGSELAPGKKGTSKKYIMEAVEASLQRLQTDYIDLYQSHWPDPETPYEETLEAYGQLIQQGKIRAFGTSNYSAEQLTASLEAARQHSLLPYQTLQPEYNLYDRSDFENGLQQVCIENNMGVISYFALASGFLTGKYRSEEDLSKSKRGAGVKKYFNERGFRILKALDEVSAKYHTTPASVSIAWLLTRPAITAPIASATSAEQIKALVEATELRLDAGDLDLLATASDE